MGWYLNVGRLKTLLGKYDDSAVVMVSESREDGASEADDSPTYCFIASDGDLVDECDPAVESTVGMKRALVLHGVEK